VGVGLHVGFKRKNAPNEDSLLAIQSMRTTGAGVQPVSFFAVADGMGGHANGQLASRLAVQSLNAVLVSTLLGNMPGNDDFSDVLLEGVRCANLAVYQRNREDTNASGSGGMMGTTMTAALVVGVSVYVANVGDSRTYLYSASNGLSQITQDHSYVARLVRDGLLEPQGVYTHPRRNEIERALGERASVEIDSFKQLLQVDDILLLCSDGLWEMVRDADIADILKCGRNATQMSHMLVQAALNRGGADNISVVVAYVKDS
jgi:serine/threonine protein phosphatase PrpC